MKKIVCLFSGGASALKFLLEQDKNYGVTYEVVAGVTNKSGTKGELLCWDHDISFAELNTKKFCIENGYDGKLSDMPDSLREDYFANLAKMISQFNPDIIMLSGFMLRITEPLLGLCPIINVHPADLRILGEDRLPKYRGDNAVYDAVVAGETHTASTIHYVTSEVDCGEIICVSNPLWVDPEMNAKEHQIMMKFSCDGPAMQKALEILCAS